jgi:hypothetical protein
MEQKLQQQEIGRKGQSSLPATLSPVGVKMRIAYFGYGAVPSTLLLAYMSQGQFGASGAIGAVLGTAAAYFAPEIHQTIKPALHTASHVLAYLNRNNSGKVRHRLMDTHWWLTGERPIPYVEDEEEEEEDQADELKEATDPELPGGVTDGRGASIPRKFALSEPTVEAIQDVNRMRQIYFGQTSTRQVVIRIDDMYHVMDVASSGKGKSNRFRLAMMQTVDLAETYFINPLANNVKAVNDSRKIEVWKPIFDRLANKRPVKDGAEILQLMTALVNEAENRHQLEASGDFSWQENPIFVFIDELPEVFARCPEAVELLDKIGRIGRQSCIFAWVASQTAAVKEIGQSLAAQANYKTRIYGGGDRNSSSRLMKGSIPMEQEQALQTNGAGLTLMLADGFSNTEFVRAPLVTNESVFQYFGLPPFQMSEWLAPAGSISRQPVQRLDESVKPSLSPFTLSPKEDIHAQKPSETPGERVKGERGERVKGPNEEAILDALNALEEDKKPLTLNAISRKAGLTWHQYEEIEMVAAWSGYELDRGKGRPKEG